MKKDSHAFATLAVLLFLVYGSVTSGTIAAEATRSSVLEHPSEPNLFFDKAFYYPPANALWDQKASVLTVKITLDEKYAASRAVKVKIFSSVDEKKVELTRVAQGRFEGRVLVKCLRLEESPSDATVFNARYGDTIIARYVGRAEATALIAFPRYVLEGFLNNPFSWWLFDSEGVPLVDYGPPIGIQYNPVEVGHYALANYHMYLATGNSVFREKFLVQANWLVKNANQKDGFNVWEYKFDWPSFNCTSPWASAMAQGEGLSVLTRAYVLTKNTTYLEVAQASMRSFESEMDSGGVRHFDENGVWYEEYADAGAPSSKVLNGFMFALFGLFEYSFETNSNEGYGLFWEGARTLALNLHQYDTGSWSYYDLFHLTPAPLPYHRLHVNQLVTMYKLTGEQAFQVYGDLFNSYMI